MDRIRIAKVIAGLALGFTVASCIVQAQPEPVAPAAKATEGPAETRTASIAEGESNLPDGAYSCTIDRYDPFPCRVTTDPDGRQRLEKLGGSQRFSGIVSPTAQGFDFRGTYFCPYGDCTEAVSGQFTAYDDGLFRGTMGGERPVTVTVQYTEFGGYAYGGDQYAYGGYGYGAGLYGYGY